MYRERRNVSAVAQVSIELGRCLAVDITEDTFHIDATDDRRSVEFHNRAAYRGYSATIPSSSDGRNVAPQLLNIVTVGLKCRERGRIKR